MTTLVAVKPKSAWLSKRFWLNATTAIVGGLTLLQEIIPELEKIVDIPSQWSAIIVTALAVANIILLRVSPQPVRFRDAENKAVALERAA